MDTPCDRSGCHMPALWVCLYRDRAVTEPYLCDLHWSVLSLRDADRAHSYVPLAAEPVELRRAELYAAP